MRAIITPANPRHRNLPVQTLSDAAGAKVLHLEKYMHQPATK
jgi:hypothetical protein